MKYSAPFEILIYCRQSPGEYKIQVVNLNYIVLNRRDVTANMDGCMGNRCRTAIMGTVSDSQYDKHVYVPEGER